MSLKNKIVVITGAASPIGATVARAMVAEGAHVILGDLMGKELAELAAEVGGAPYVVGDLGDEVVAKRLIDTAITTHKRIDVLVNNAGGGIIRPFLEHTPDTLRETVNRNLWTCLWACREALPHMVARNYGRIVNVGADSVRNGLWDHAAYNAAKGGMHGLTTGLAREFAGHDITVNTVAPCMVRTPAIGRMLEAGDAYITRFTTVIPKGRPAELEEVSSMILYLARDEARFVTGQVISVNGGSTML